MSQLPPLGGFFRKDAEAYILPPKKKPKKKSVPVTDEDVQKEAEALFKQAAAEELSNFYRQIQQLDIK
jgi:hypothetical protein